MFGLWAEAFGMVAQVESDRQRAKARQMAQRHAADMQLQIYRNILGTNVGNQSFAVVAKPRSKCESCGSREFEQRHGESVCVYCRQPE